MIATFPIFGGLDLPIEAQYLPAILIGFGFGFVLERSGFGNSRILAAQFYLKNMRVFKVMFSAIITAAAGLALASAAGLLSLGDLFIPQTFLVPHLVGGLLLGIGFIISGYCPGTAVVGAASGKWDGAMTLVGVVLGSLIFGEVFPLLETFHTMTAMQVFTAPELLGLSYEILVLGVIVMAVGMFFGAEKVEALFSKEKERSWIRPALTGLASLVLVGAVAVGLSFTALSDPAPIPTKVPLRMTAVDLAGDLVEQPDQLYVIDLREGCMEQETRIPYAICAEELEANPADLWAGRKMVLYGAEVILADDLPPRFMGYKGNLAILDGGFEAWQGIILKNSAAARAELPKNQQELVPVLHGHFTGTKVKAVKRPKVKIQREMNKTGGCS